VVIVNCPTLEDASDGADTTLRMQNEVHPLGNHSETQQAVTSNGFAQFVESHDEHISGTRVIFPFGRIKGEFLKSLPHCRYGPLSAVDGVAKVKAESAFAFCQIDSLLIDALAPSTCECKLVSLRSTERFAVPGAQRLCCGHETDMIAPLDEVNDVAAHLADMAEIQTAD
jgi:hypothetical protein